MNEDMLRQLPSIDELMKSPEAEALITSHGRETVVDAVRLAVGNARAGIVNNETVDASPGGILGAAAHYVSRRFAPSIHHAINAAGIVLHTGLGRAMLSEPAVSAIHDAIKGYCTLAVDLETGQRGSRDVHVSDLLCELTGAEAATVVNNNAAATMIILNTLAKGKEVIVSRGQLVEIGGSFRMPEVMEMSGAVLREIGTTNKTHLRDYISAINENTGAILRVHQSNYRIVGFAEEPSVSELAVVAREHNLPLVDDLGSGALVDLRVYGVEPEPLVQDSVKAGADLACFSGDKLIGGPQCGVIVGKGEWVARIKKNPLARAFRVGKMTVAGLEATLKLFLRPDRLNLDHPTYRMLSMTLEEMEPRALAAVKSLGEKVGSLAEVCRAEGMSQVGSGSVAAEMIPTLLMSVKPTVMSADVLARSLRKWKQPVLARIRQDSVLFDFRTIQPDEDERVIEVISEILTQEEKHDRP